MSQRARDYVDYWIAEFLQPDIYEDEADMIESRANAAQCLRSAMARGIAREEIVEEFGDLVSHIARAHKRVLDAELHRLTRFRHSSHP